MSGKDEKGTRRNFPKTVGILGAGSIVTATVPVIDAAAGSDARKSATKIVSKRPFGKTGVNVSILSLGGVLNMSDQLP